MICLYFNIRICGMERVERSVDSISWKPVFGQTSIKFVSSAGLNHGIIMYNIYIYKSPLPFPLLKGWTRAWYHPLFRGEFKQKKWTRAPVFVAKGRALSCSGVPFGTQKSEMHFVVIYFGMRCVVPETSKPSFAGYARLHEHIVWTLRPFLALDSRLFRGKMSPQKIENKNDVETLRRKNGTDLVLKPINWIWSCALRSILLPHSSDDCSSKSLCGALVTSILAINYMRLPIIINLNLSYSARFLLLLSNSQVSPKFKESMLRVPFAHNVTKHRFDAWCRGFWMTFVMHCILY